MHDESDNTEEFYWLNKNDKKICIIKGMTKYEIIIIIVVVVKINCTKYNIYMK